jgi:ferredoxin
MTYVVTDACIRCKYTDCVSVCPVDCFREGANMLVIDPDECIDCAVCVPECPANAILADDDPEARKWIAHNAEYAVLWPMITREVPAPADADAWKDRPDKMAEFDPAPAQRATA